VYLQIDWECDLNLIHTIFKNTWHIASRGVTTIHTTKRVQTEFHVIFSCFLLGVRYETDRKILSVCTRYRRTAVAQWLRCCVTNRKDAGSIPAGVSEFFIDIKSFRSHYGPGVDSASNRNEYQEYFLGVKTAGA